MIKINTKLIKQKMAEQNLTVASLARTCGLSVATINKLLGSRSCDFRAYTIYKIACVLNMSADKILGRC